MLSPDSLRSDFAYLKGKGYTAVFVREIVDFCDGKGDLPEKPVVLTFDDGFYNNLYYALPIAQAAGMKICVGIVGSYVQKEEGEKKRSPVYSYLNKEELRVMAQSGAVEFMNHTYDMHRSAPRKGVRRKCGESVEDYAQALTADSEKCRALVFSATDRKMNVFAYPFGCYSADTARILNALGYRAALTCKGGINTFRKGSTDGLQSIMRYNRSGNESTEAFFRRIGV